MNPNVGVVVFTVIEVVTLVVWLILAGLPFDPSPAHIAAVLALAIGIFFEHFVSYNVGTGQSFFRFPLQRPSFKS